MVSLFAAVWLVPALWGAISGYWRAGRPALTATDFAKDIGIAALTAAIPIYMFHMVWAGAFMNVAVGYNALGSWASYWTALTALIWFPLMVIAYIIRATRIKNADR